jgi:hypothetical protein
MRTTAPPSRRWPVAPRRGRPVGGGSARASGTPAVRLPEIPAVTPPPTLPGDQLAALIHGGPGSSGLRNFADAWRAHADTLDELADHVLSRGAAIDEHWIDGYQRAGANTREHGYWLRSSADQARTIAAGASQVAEQFDTAKNATPTPAEFDAARREFTAAQARRDPTGMAMAARKYAQMQAQAVNAAMAYHGGATGAANTLGTPLQTAPAIARGGAHFSMLGDKTDIDGAEGGAGSIGAIAGGGGGSVEGGGGADEVGPGGGGASEPGGGSGLPQAGPGQGFDAPYNPANRRGLTTPAPAPGANPSDATSSTEGGGGESPEKPAEAPPFPPPTKITGTTNHGADQVMSRDGHGVNDSALQDAFAHPTQPPMFELDETGRGA